MKKRRRKRLLIGYEPHLGCGGRGAGGVEIGEEEKKIKIRAKTFFLKPIFRVFKHTKSVSVLLSASVEGVSVSRMRDF